MGSLDDPPGALAENHRHTVRIVLHLVSRCRSTESLGPVRNKSMSVLIREPTSLLTRDTAQESKKFRIGHGSPSIVNHLLGRIGVETLGDIRT